MLNLKVKLLGGHLPEWKGIADAGLDLKASEYLTLDPGEIRAAPLGIATEFDPLYVGLIKDRSSIAMQGVFTGAGVIDSSYRGEWKVIMRNTSGETFSISRGDRIAQVIFIPCFHLIVKEVVDLSDSSRGIKGFGSTGK